MARHFAGVNWQPTLNGVSATLEISLTVIAIVPMAPSGSPIISVLLPVYNAERYLADAVESVLGQSFAEFELIAFDDGSSDGSLELLQKYAARDPRVRVLTRENRGLVATLNEMIDIARGRYLARMDADDICLPHRFELQAAFLDAHPDHLVVGGWVEWMNERGQPISVIRTPAQHEEIDRAHLSGNTSIWHPTAMIRRSVDLPSGWYDEQYASAEDIDLWLRVAEHGKLANIPEILLRYRIHQASISEAKGDLQLAAMRNACIAAWRRRGIEGTFQGPGHWRPDPDRASRHSFAVRYGWTAWAHGYRGTWWTYACQALWLAPFAPSSWNLMIGGLLKRPVHPEATSGG